MRAYGAPAADIEAVEAALQHQRDASAAQAQEEFVVYHDNWLVAQTFLRCQTQWERAGMLARRSGLHYPGVDIVLKHFVPKKKQAEVLDCLQLMERAVLAYDAEHADKD